MGEITGPNHPLRLKIYPSITEARDIEEERFQDVLRRAFQQPRKRRKKNLPAPKWARLTLIRMGIPSGSMAER